MEERYMRLSEARDYIRERYGVQWTVEWLRRLCLGGTLRYVRPGAGRGWIYVSRDSIDERFRQPGQIAIAS
jgi:hypothetical protein